MKTLTKLFLVSTILISSACAVTPNDEVVIVPTRSGNTGVHTAHNCIVYNRYGHANERDYNEVLNRADGDSGSDNLRRSAELAGRTTPNEKPLCRPKANVYIRVP